MKWKSTGLLEELAKAAEGIFPAGIALFIIRIVRIGSAKEGYA